MFLIQVHAHVRAMAISPLPIVRDGHDDDNECDDEYDGSPM